MCTGNHVTEKHFQQELTTRQTQYFLLECRIKREIPIRKWSVSSWRMTTGSGRSVSSGRACDRGAADPVSAPCTCIMPPLHFCANLTWLFTELPEISQRIYAAAAAGFRAVEAAWPYDEDLQELQRAREATGVDMVLINTPPGNVRAGDLGLGAVPGREHEFREGLDKAIEYAQGLQCKRIHLMAGRVPQGSDRAQVAQEMENIFIQNLEYAADVLSKRGITGLIEPINTRITDPTYFLDSPHHAVAILEKVGKPNLKLQMDIFHWQIMDGNLTQNIIRYFPHIGHVQVAQVPERNEPDSPGEINYSYVFDVLERQHYHGFVGCEYRPLGGTTAGLGWLREYWTQTEAQD